MICVLKQGETSYYGAVWSILSLTNHHLLYLRHVDFLQVLHVHFILHYSYELMETECVKADYITLYISQTFTYVINGFIAYPTKN